MVLLSKTAFAGIQQKQSWGCAPLFSTHVRWCEHGAPVLCVLSGTGQRGVTLREPLSRSSTQYLLPVGLVRCLEPSLSRYFQVPLNFSPIANRGFGRRHSFSMQLLPEKMMEIGMVAAGVVGLLILIAPNFGLKPKETVDGWCFPVKPTCLLLYYLALTSGIGAVGYGATRLLASGTSDWIGWACFGIGFLLVPVVLADWPEPLILDGQGLLESGCASTRIHWQELMHVRQYRIRCDRGVVIHGAGGKELVVADIAYDSRAVLDCLLRWRAVPFYSLQDEMRPISILSDHYSQ